MTRRTQRTMLDHGPDETMWVLRRDSHDQDGKDEKTKRKRRRTFLEMEDTVEVNT